MSANNFTSGGGGSSDDTADTDTEDDFDDTDTSDTSTGSSSTTQATSGSSGVSSSPDPRTDTGSMPDLSPGDVETTEASDTATGSSSTTQATSGGTDSTSTDTSTTEFNDELGGDPAGSPDPARDTSDVEFSDRQVKAADQLDSRFENTDIEPQDVVVADGTARLTDAAAESVGAAQRGAAGDLVGDPANAPPPPEAETDAPEQQAEPEQQSDLDRLVNDRLDPAAETYRQRVSEPAGRALADATPAAQIERRVLGTNRLDRTFESAGTTVAQGGNLPGIAAGTIRGAQTVDDAVSRSFDPVVVGGVTTGVVVPNPSGQEEVAADAADAGTAAAADAAANPFRTTGSLIGGAAIGVGSARAASGASRRLSQFDGPDAEEFVRDTRAQTGGRNRGDSDTIEQKTITVERMADEDVIDAETREVEDIPGVSVENANRATDVDADATDARTVSKLEDDIRSSLDDDLREDTRSTTQLENDIQDSLDEDLLEGTQSRQATQTAAAGTVGRGIGAAEAGAFVGAGTSLDATATADVDTAQQTADTVSALDTDQIADTVAVSDVAVGVTTTIGDTTTIADTTTVADTTATADTTAETTTTTTQQTVGTTLTDITTTRPPRTEPVAFGGVEDDLDRFSPGFDDAQFTNPTQSLDEVDDALAEDLGGGTNGP